MINWFKQLIEEIGLAMILVAVIVALPLIIWIISSLFNK